MQIGNFIFHTLYLTQYCAHHTNKLYTTVSTQVLQYLSIYWNIQIYTGISKYIIEYPNAHKYTTIHIRISKHMLQYPSVYSNTYSDIQTRTPRVCTYNMSKNMILNTHTLLGQISGFFNLYPDTTLGKITAMGSSL